MEARLRKGADKDNYGELSRELSSVGVTPSRGSRVCTPRAEVLD